MLSPAWALLALAAAGDAPSRPPVQGCAWEKLSDARLGLEAWVQRCDLGFRRIDFLVKGSAVLIRYSDGGDPDPVVEVIDLLPEEMPEAGMQRVFRASTDRALASRCVLAPFEGESREGALRYTFIPDAAYEKELNANATPDEVPDPPCGDWGTTPDGIQYFEVQPSSGSRRVLFVRLGQDEPLFDEKTLRLLPR